MTNMIDWYDIERLNAMLDRLEEKRGVVSQPLPPRKPTREEIIDAAIANLSIDRPGMTKEDRKRLKAELLEE